MLLINLKEELNCVHGEKKIEEYAGNVENMLCTFSYACFSVSLPFHFSHVQSHALLSFLINRFPVYFSVYLLQVSLLSNEVLGDP